MKNLLFALIALFSFSLLSSCAPIDSPDATGEFQIVKDGDVILDHSDIEYYDFSTHVIYLNEANRLGSDIERLEGATVKVGAEEIYSLRIQYPHSSTFPPGSHVFLHMDVYGDFAFKISFASIEDEFGNTTEDPRGDSRIRSALERDGKLREGLSVEIVSVEQTGTKIKTKLRLRNLDPIPYHHLDPNKMGNGLFHFFTNGLTFFNPEIPQYVYDTTVSESPVPWNYWTNDWLAEIGGNQTKEWVFTYSLGAIPQGKELNFWFDFPSPHLAITSRDALDFNGSRIWLGKVGSARKVRF